MTRSGRSHVENTYNSGTYTEEHLTEWLFIKNKAQHHHCMHRTHFLWTTHPPSEPCPACIVGVRRRNPDWEPSTLRQTGYTSATRPRSEVRATAEAPYLGRVPDRSESGETSTMTSAVAGSPLPESRYGPCRRLRYHETHNSKVQSPSYREHILNTIENTFCTRMCTNT